MREKRKEMGVIFFFLIIIKNIYIEKTIKSIAEIKYKDDKKNQYVPTETKRLKKKKTKLRVTN